MRLRSSLSFLLAEALVERASRTVSIRATSHPHSSKTPVRADKMTREDGEDRLSAEVAEKLADQYPSDKIAEGFKNVLKGEVRRRILEKGIRPDGRALDEIRPITCEVGTLPRTHGSGLFTRGQTQVLSIATLASLSMKQTLDTVGPDDTRTYMHHYNFPPYSTGEARRVGSPGRREIGQARSGK